VELGVHLPLMEFRDEGQSLGRLQAAVDAAAQSGFVAVSANDHFVFSTLWLDGPTALAAVIDRSGEMTLATTIALAALRGPVPLAKALMALDVLSGGRVIAGVGPGSSERDYDAVGIPFHDRWKRFDESVRILRTLLRQESPPDDTRYFTAHDLALRPAPVQAGGVPLWIGSWGSAAGLRRVARLGDGWLASAYNTTPDQFASANGLLGDELRRQGRHAEQFPNALVTMWTWITESQSERERILSDVLAPLLNRPVDELRERVCVGSAEKCGSFSHGMRAAGVSVCTSGCWATSRDR
jgi:alkanesulfonate monooxygenase SsuD/methylene tetrahydromethanopterin reductase-like flavin-dependent oxidoreductase (luciferase family)